MNQFYQPDLFLQPRIPHKPYCKNHKNALNRIRSYASAIKHRYIQVNPPHLRTFLLFDIDRCGAAIAWEDAGLPMPAWSAINRENGHAHIAYALSAPVLTADFEGRQRPLRYLAAIEAAYKADLGGDAGFVSLITKNPVHPHWRTLRGVPEAIAGYDLHYLAEFVDLRRFRPKIGKTNLDAEGLGRNCTVFNVVSRWAYSNVLPYKAEAGFRAWSDAVLRQCLLVNGDFPVPMHGKEVNCIARSIGKWVWNRFSIEGKAQWHAAQNARRKNTTNAGRKSILSLEHIYGKSTNR